MKLYAMFRCGYIAALRATDPEAAETEAAHRWPSLDTFVISDNTSDEWIESWKNPSRYIERRGGLVA